MLSRLIYASAVDAALRPDELNRLLEHARLRNGMRGITGLLAFDRRHFLQVIEGSARTLSDLYASLLRDPRHREVLLLKFARIDARRFPHWSMGFVPADQTYRALVARHTAAVDFDPFSLDGEAAEALLSDLAVANADRATAALAPG